MKNHNKKFHWIYFCCVLVVDVFVLEEALCFIFHKRKTHPVDTWQHHDALMKIVKKQCKILF